MQHHNMILRQKHTKIHTDISIIDSKIKDLESQNQNVNKDIEDILIEKRKVDKDNEELEMKLAGRGMTEAEAKMKQFDAEREQKLKYKNSVTFNTEINEHLMERLKDEENKGKDMLDLKIKLD